jgi:transcriptional regulator with XRE-family HTH domain
MMMLVVLLEKIGENIRKIRHKLGLTQQELADRVSISRSVLTRWENGSLTPDVDTLVKLSQLFNVSLDGLVGSVYNRAQILHEVRQIYQADEESLDEEMLEIMAYLKHQEEIKKGLFQLSQMNVKNRKSVEEILKVTFRELIK